MANEREDAPKKPTSPQAPDGGYGWIIVLSTTLINISVMPLYQNFGLIYKDQFKNLGITAAQTSFLLHLYTAMYCSLSLLVGTPLLKKFNFRQVALIGVLLMCLGIFLTSWIDSYGLMIATFSLLVGTGQGVMLPANYLAANSYFKKRLTLATSFSVTGAGISNIFMPQVCKQLLKHFDKDTTGTVLVLSALALLAVPSCFLLRPLSRPKENAGDQECAEQLKTDDVPLEDRERGPKNEENSLLNPVYHETTLPSTPSPPPPPPRLHTVGSKLYHLLDLELLKNRQFVITIIGMSISFASELNIVVMIQFILPELARFTLEDVALVLSIQSIADIVGRLLVPLVGYKFQVSPKIMYSASLVTSTVGRTVIAVFYESRGLIYACVLLLGLAKGTKAVYQSVIIPQYVELEKLPAANGLSMLLSGSASLILGPIIGAVHDVTQSYVYALHTGSAISMGCVLLWIQHYYSFERKQKVVSGNGVVTS